MAKKLGRPKGPERNDSSVKIHRHLATKLKRIAEDRGVPVADVLSELAEAPINKAYGALLRKLDQEAGA